MVGQVFSEKDGLVERNRSTVILLGWCIFGGLSVQFLFLSAFGRVLLTTSRQFYEGTLGWIRCVEARADLRLAADVW